MTSRPAEIPTWRSGFRPPINANRQKDVPSGHPFLFRICGIWQTIRKKRKEAGGGRARRRNCMADTNEEKQKAYESQAQEQAGKRKYRPFPMGRQQHPILDFIAKILKRVVMAIAAPLITLATGRTGAETNDDLRDALKTAADQKTHLEEENKKLRDEINLHGQDRAKEAGEPDREPEQEAGEPEQEAGEPDGKTEPVPENSEPACVLKKGQDGNYWMTYAGVSVPAGTRLPETPRDLLLLASRMADQMPEEMKVDANGKAVSPDHILKTCAAVSLAAMVNMRLADTKDHGTMFSGSRIGSGKTDEFLVLSDQKGSPERMLNVRKMGKDAVVQAYTLSDVSVETRPVALSGDATKEETARQLIRGLAESVQKTPHLLPEGENRMLGSVSAEELGSLLANAEDDTHPFPDTWTRILGTDGGCVYRKQGLDNAAELRVNNDGTLVLSAQAARARWVPDKETYRLPVDEQTGHIRESALPQAVAHLTKMMDGPASQRTKEKETYLYAAPMMTRPESRFDLADQKYPGDVGQYLAQKLNQYLEVRALTNHENPNITRNDLIRAGAAAGVRPDDTGRFLDRAQTIETGVFLNLEKPDEKGRMALKEAYVQKAYQHALSKLIVEKYGEAKNQADALTITPKELSGFIADDLGGKPVSADGKDMRIGQAETACALFGKATGMRYDEAAQALTVEQDGISRVVQSVQPDMERDAFVDRYLRNADDNMRIYQEEIEKEAGKEEPAEDAPSGNAPDAEREEQAPEKEQPAEEEPEQADEEPEIDASDDYDER